MAGTEGREWMEEENAAYAAGGADSPSKGNGNSKDTGGVGGNQDNASSQIFQTVKGIMAMSFCGNGCMRWMRSPTIHNHWRLRLN